MEAGYTFGDGAPLAGPATPPMAGSAPPATSPQPAFTSIKTPSGLSFQVDQRYAPNFQGFVNELEGSGYKIRSIGGVANRNIAGTNTPSEHAFGDAIDINPDTNALGSGRGDLPPNVADIAKRYGLGWGGQWKSKNDPMHFSVATGEGGTGAVYNPYGQQSPPDLTPDEQKAWAALQPSAPTTPGGQTEAPGNAPVRGAQGQSLTQAQAKYYSENAPAGGWDSSPGMEGTAAMPYALQRGSPLPATPGAHYVDFDGIPHVVPGGPAEKAAGVFSGVLQGVGSDVINSAIKLTGGGLAVDPMGSALAQTQGGPGVYDLSQGALRGAAQQEHDYSIRNMGNEFAQGGRFTGQALPATAAAALIPEVELPGMAAKGIGGVLSRVGSKVATNALRGVAATAPTVGANDAPVRQQLATGALGGVVVPPVLNAAGKAGVAMADMGASRAAAAGVDAASPVNSDIARRAAAYVASKNGAPNTLMADAASAGKPVMAAEMMGQPGIEALRTLGRRSGATGQALQDTVEKRAADAPGSIADDYAARAGVAPDAARGKIEDLVSAGRARVAPVYQDAYTMAMPQSDKLDAILNRPSMTSAINRGAALAAEEGRDPMALGFRVHPDGSVDSISRPTMQTMDYIKRGLDDVLEARRDPVTGQLPTDNQTRALQDTRVAYRDAITGDNSAATRLYGSALRQSGDYLSARDAYDFGRTATFNTAVKPEEFAGRFAGFNSTEQDAFKAGQARAIAELQGSGRLKPTTFMAPDVQSKLRVTLGDDGARDFLGAVSQTRQMMANNARLNPNINSPTSNVALEARNQDAFGNGARGVLGEITADFGGGTLAGGGNPLVGAKYALLKQGMKAAAAFGDYIASGGLNEATRDEAGRILMSNMQPSALQGYLSRTTAPRTSGAGNALRGLGNAVRPTEIPLSALGSNFLLNGGGALSSVGTNP